MSDWQPIETAPKDGTVVELNGEHRLYPMRGLWAHGEWRAEQMSYTLGPARLVPDPTHWTPLNESPPAIP